MKLSTSESIWTDHPTLMKTIINFWDNLSEPIDNLRGHHLHHGYFEENASLSIIEAQELLLEKLSSFAEIGDHERILDAGCGLGSTGIFLAQRFNAQVSGVTISAKQVEMAREKAANSRVTGVDFLVEDALSLKSFQDESFDVVWCLDSCSQFLDKLLFFRQAYRVLKPGGKLLLAAWCSSRDEYTDYDAREYMKLCKSFNIPYLPSIASYTKLLKEAGFTVNKQEDWSEKVEKTWTMSHQILSITLFQRLFVLLLRGGPQFFRLFENQKLMQKAYRENRMRYGVFLGQKPAS